jgi:hypothetical protein
MDEHHVTIDQGPMGRYVTFRIAAGRSLHDYNSPREEDIELRFQLLDTLKAIRDKAIEEIAEVRAL